ncbi:DUF2993 domain-containing protein [Sphaerothrix gracilis]|uniref:LmeA family phospholipid-binding protein n=1 Tax=Sphaerothrix gracilis TaxID=3151835 RepID=UPI0031FC7743
MSKRKEADLGEQAISKAVEVGLDSQLDEAENLDVDVKTDPVKLMQGDVDYVEIDGEGLVMEKGLRTEKLQLATDNISINPLQAAVGEIELEKAVDAKTFVVLTETDIENAFNSDYVRAKLQALEVEVDGDKTQIEPRQISFSIPQADTVCLKAEVKLVKSQEIRQVAFQAQPEMTKSGHQVQLNQVEPLAGAANDPQLTQALIQVAGELLDLRNFELDGMALRFDRLTVQPGQIKLQAKATIDDLPGM